MTARRTLLGPLAAAALASTALACWCSPARAYIFFNPSGRDLESAALDGTNVHNVNEYSTRLQPVGLASNGAHVYLGLSDPEDVVPNNISRVNPDGTGYIANFVHVSLPACDQDSSGMPGEDAIAVDGSHIYWADTFAGTIGRANLADGSSPNAQFIVASGGDCSVSPGTGPRGLAVDGSHIYWTNPDQGAIGRANLDGSAPTPTFITGAHQPWAVAVSGPNIYWDNTVDADGPTTIGHAQLDAAGALIPGSVNQSFITGLTGTTANPNELAAQGGYLYFDNGDGWIGKATIDGTNVVHHLFLAYDPTDANTLPALAVDGGQASPTKTSLACQPTSLGVLDPAPNASLLAPVGNATICTAEVRDVGSRPGPVAGSVLLTESPVAGGFVSAEGDLVARAACALKRSSTPGLSNCTFEYATSAHVHGYLRNAPHTTLTATYSSETTHTSSTGGVAVALRRVHACIRTGDSYQQVCNAQGQLAGVVRIVSKGGTRITTYVLYAGGLSVTFPDHCVAAGKGISVKLAFTAAKGDHGSLQRVDFKLGGHRSTAGHAPFTARLTVPAGRRRASPSLTVHLVFSNPPGADFGLTVKLGVPAC
jgi:hypothetical protein